MRTVVSYTAFSPLPAYAGGYFLLHFPGSHLRRTLSGILPCGARTFLTNIIPAIVRFAQHVLYNTCQINLLNTYKKKIIIKILRISTMHAWSILSIIPLVLHVKT